jgi:hypothetical protein
LVSRDQRRLCGAVCRSVRFIYWSPSALVRKVRKVGIPGLDPVQGENIFFNKNIPICGRVFNYPHFSHLWLLYQINVGTKAQGRVVSRDQKGPYCAGCARARKPAVMPYVQVPTGSRGCRPLHVQLRPAYACKSWSLGVGRGWVGCGRGGGGGGGGAGGGDRATEQR